MIAMGVKIIAADGTLTLAGYEMLTDLAAGLAATQAKLAAAADVAAPSGGATVDAQARANLALIKAALA